MLPRAYFRLPTRKFRSPRCEFRCPGTSLIVPGVGFHVKSVDFTYQIRWNRWFGVSKTLILAIKDEGFNVFNKFSMILTFFFFYPQPRWINRTNKGIVYTTRIRAPLKRAKRPWWPRATFRSWPPNGLSFSACNCLVGAGPPCGWVRPKQAGWEFRV